MPVDVDSEGNVIERLHFTSDHIDGTPGLLPPGWRRVPNPPGWWHNPKPVDDEE